MKIKAAVVRQRSGPFRVEEVDLDEPREDEVLVRIAGTGFCHTDVASRDGYLPTPLPIVLGHEGSGVVEQVGTGVRKVKPGDHVVMSYVACGTCFSCRKGEETLCLNNFSLNLGGMRPDGSLTMQKDGEPIHGSYFGQSSFASHALAFERNTVRVPDDVPIEILGPLGCGVQTGAGSVINSLRARPGSSLAVFGTGGVGMSAILAAVVSGCTTIIAVDVKEARLKTAREFGATHTINPLEADPVETIRDITHGGVDFILETTGSGRVIRQAVDALAFRGKCGLVGTPSPGEEMHLAIQPMHQGRSIFGILEGDAISDIFIPMMIELYRQGRFPFDRMITFYSLDQINEAVADAESGKVLKAVLRP